MDPNGVSIAKALWCQRECTALVHLTPKLSAERQGPGWVKFSGLGGITETPISASREDRSRAAALTYNCADTYVNGMYRDVYPKYMSGFSTKLWDLSLMIDNRSLSIVQMHISRHNDEQ
jgi:hypothetical protein